MIRLTAGLAIALAIAACQEPDTDVGTGPGGTGSTTEIAHGDLDGAGFIDPPTPSDHPQHEPGGGGGGQDLPMLDVGAPPPPPCQDDGPPSAECDPSGTSGETPEPEPEGLDESGS